MNMKKNIWKHSDLSTLLTELKGKKIVLAGGCFDLIHYGHFSFLQNAKKEGDVVIIALESDEFIQSSKKRKPVHNHKQRAEILANLEMVDHVILLPLFTSDKDYEDLVLTIKPAVIAVTSGDSQIEKKKKYAELIDADVKVVSSLLPEFSTTNIITYEDISRS